MSRMIVVDQVATRPCKATRSIVPGDSCADLLMTLVMLSSVDEAIVLFPDAHFGLLADDLQVAVVSKVLELELQDSSVEVALGQISSFLINALESTCKLEVSDTKLKVVSNKTGIPHKVAKKHKKLNNSAAHTVRNLGVDFSAGKVVKRLVQKKRVDTVYVRSLRLRQVMKAGAQVANILAAGLHKAGAYGVEVMGMPPLLRKKFRAHSHMALTKSHTARSATIDFALQSNQFFDPAFYILSSPALWFLAALWDGTLSRDLLLRTLSTAVFRLNKKPSWNMVIGPASATVMSLKSFGWDIHATMLTLWGPIDNHLDTERFCPRDMQSFMYADIQISLWENMSCAGTIFEGVRGLPWLQPIRMLLNKKVTAKWIKKHKNILRSLAAMAIWTKDRFKVSGYIVDDKCLCGEIETLKHILWHCPQTEAHRKSWELDESITNMLRQHPSWSGWITGIAKDPSWGYPRAVDEVRIEWVSGPNGNIFSTHAFGDGSGTSAKVSIRLRRCGWGVTEAWMGPDSVIRHGAHAFGPLPGPMQVVPLAELFAFLIFLTYAQAVEAVYDFYTDCAYVKNGFEKGRYAMCNAWSAHAGTWTQVFDKIDDIGYDNISVHKVKAHQKIIQQTTLVERFLIQANSKADTIAKQGADMQYKNQILMDSIKNEFKTMLQICKYITFTYDYYRRNIVRDIIKIPYLRNHKPFRSIPPPEKCLHSFDSIGTNLRCVMCLVKRSKHILRDRCSYNVHTLGHNIWAVPPFCFCINCGSYTNDRIGALSKPCPNSTPTIHFLRAKARLLEGTHPVTENWLSPPYPVSKISFRTFANPPEEFDELEIVDLPEPEPT